MIYLTKSDFTSAIECCCSLYYRKLGYPDTKTLDEYLEYFAEGGYMVLEFARLKYPEGILIDTDRDLPNAIQLTSKYLKQKNVTLFEATILTGKKLIKVDILEKKGNHINLIEVKSKSYDSTDDERVKKEMRKHLEESFLDLAFQYYVFKEAYPEFKIKPYLFLPDKVKRTMMDGLNLCFRIEDISTETGYEKFNITVDESKIDDLRKENIMELVDCEEIILEMLPMVKEESKKLLKSFNGNISKIDVPLTKNCFKCAFSFINEEHPISGLEDCWKEIPKAEHHIKDLFRVGSLGGWRNPTANKWIKNKITSMFDVPTEDLTGTYGEREIIQIEHTKTNTEWIGNEFKEIISSVAYPLHFIDFETFAGAFPFHSNMRPYEKIAFQWSCHTIKKPGDEPIHSEWLNLENKFPSFEFAETLMKQIGDSGTPLMWSSYENTVLRDIYEQTEFYNYDSPELKTWLENIVRFDKDDGRLFDMEKIALKQYFHPKMKGRTSIKVVLPAVLSSINSTKIENWLKSFESNLSLYKNDENGNIINAYELLPAFEIYEKSEHVNEGTGAMRAYGELMFGLKKGDSESMNKYRNALLKYCKLDTLSMVIIWEYWNSI